MADHGSWEYESLSELDLAHRVAAGDPRARDEVRRRYAPLAVAYARRLCSRIAHRSGRCPGWSCELAFVSVYGELLDRFAGHARDRRHRRPRKGLIVRWTEQDKPPETFAKYVGYLVNGKPDGKDRRGTGLVREAIRVWNRDRGLVMRPRPDVAMQAHAAQRYARLIASEPLATAAGELGLDRSDAVFPIIAALALDACQTGVYDPIDVARVARDLVPERAEPPGVERAVGLLARAVDTLVATEWPAWYDKCLDRPRQHTRQGLPLADWDFGEGARDA